MDPIINASYVICINGNKLLFQFKSPTFPNYIPMLYCILCTNYNNDKSHMDERFRISFVIISYNFSSVSSMYSRSLHRGGRRGQKWREDDHADPEGRVGPLNHHRQGRQQGWSGERRDAQDTGGNDQHESIDGNDVMNTFVVNFNVA